MDNLGDLPEEVQCMVLKYYLGDSIARYFYLKSVFVGDGFARQWEMVERSFFPKRRDLHIVPDVRDRLTFRHTQGRSLQVSIANVIDVAGMGSGLVMAIEDMCSGWLEWEMGSIRISRGKVNNMYDVIELFPLNGQWSGMS